MGSLALLKLDDRALSELEAAYPGIRTSILAREAANVPPCTNCGASDTASVGQGILGRSVALAAATTKFKLVPNGPAPGRHFCNVCGRFFD